MEYWSILCQYAYNKQNAVSEDFTHKIDTYIKHANTRLYYRSLFFAMAIAVIAGVITMVIWIGSIDIIKGEMTSGQMISFIYYAIIVGMSAGGVAEIFSQMHGPLAALDRIIELMPLTCLLWFSPQRSRHGIAVSFLFRRHSH